MRRLLAHAVLAVAALAAAATTSVAAQAQDYGRPVLGVGRDQDPREGRGRQAPLSRVLATLAQRYPGRHLNTTMGDAGGRPAYFVQWQMASGRVVVFVVDAESGQVIARQGG